VDPIGLGPHYTNLKKNTGIVGRYGEEVGKSLLEGDKQERNFSEDEWQYIKKVTEQKVS
jgi:hypothetical protein